MSVSIWLVRIASGQEVPVSESINRIADTEVTEIGSGCLVAATDTDSTGGEISAVEKIRNISGVQDVILVMSASPENLGDITALEATENKA